MMQDNISTLLAWHTVFAVLVAVASLLLFFLPSSAVVHGFVLICAGMFFLFLSFWIIAFFAGERDARDGQKHFAAQVLHGFSLYYHAAKNRGFDRVMGWSLAGILVYGCYDFILYSLYLDYLLRLPLTDLLQDYFTARGHEFKPLVDPTGHEAIFGFAYYSMLIFAVLTGYWVGRFGQFVAQIYASLGGVFLILALLYGWYFYSGLDVFKVGNAPLWGLGYINANFVHGDGGLLGSVPSVFMLQAYALGGFGSVIASGIIVMLWVYHARLIMQHRLKAMYAMGGFVVICVMIFLYFLTSYDPSLRGVILLGFVVLSIGFGQLYDPKRRRYIVF